MSWITIAIVIGVAVIAFLVIYKMLSNRQQRLDDEALEENNQ